MNYPITISMMFILAAAAPFDASAEMAIVHQGGKKTPRGEVVGGSYGVVDTETGEFVIKPEYDQMAIDTSNNYIVKKHGRLGVIDRSGNILIGFKYEFIARQGNGYVVGIKYENTRIKRMIGGPIPVVRNLPLYQFGFVDVNGEILVPMEFDGINETSVAGVYQVSKTDVETGQAHGLVGTGGVIILPIEFSQIEINRISGKSKILVTATKGYKKQTLELDITVPGNGSEEATRITKVKVGDRYGYAIGSRELVPPVFEDAWDFRKGYARVKRDGKWGLINDKGNIVLEIKYDYVWDFENGKAKVRMPDGSTQYIEVAP